MSINPAKYRKLTTQPWTGNILTDPTDSLTITDLNGGSVTLTEEDGDLLINGEPIPTSGGGVTSVTAVPGSGITISPPSGTGDITVGFTATTGVSSILAGENVAVETVDNVAAVSLNATNFVSSISFSGTEFYGGGRGDVSISSYANAAFPVYYSLINPNGGQLTTDTFSCSLFDPGTYLVEINFTNQAFQFSLFKFNCSFILFKRPTGLVSCGGSHIPNINPIGQSDYVRVQVDDSVTQIVTVLTHISDFALSPGEIAVFRIL